MYIQYFNKYNLFANIEVSVELQHLLKPDSSGILVEHLNLILKQFRYNTSFEVGQGFLLVYGLTLKNVNLWYTNKDRDFDLWPQIKMCAFSANILKMPTLETLRLQTKWQTGFIPNIGLWDLDLDRWPRHVTLILSITN